MFRMLCVLCAFVCSAAYMPAYSRPAAVQQPLSSVAALDIRMVTAATKPQRVNKRNREYNKKYRSEMRTRIKRVRA